MTTAPLDARMVASVGALRHLLFWFACYALLGVLVWLFRISWRDGLAALILLLLTFVLLKYLCPIFWLWTDVVSPPVVVKIDEERGMRVSVSSVACCCAASRVTETLTLHELSRCTVRVFSQHMTMMVEELHTDAGCFEVVATGGLVREVRALSDVGETWLNLAHVLSQPGTICCGGALIYGRIFCGLELPRSLTSKGQQVLGVEGEGAD